MEAPDKIYLNISPFSGYPLNKWYKERQNDKDIEYTRTDVIVERAEKWMERFLDTHYVMRYHDSNEPIHDAILGGFEKYLKGE